MWGDPPNTMILWFVCLKPLRRSLSKNQFCREENFTYIEGGFIKEFHKQRASLAADKEAAAYLFFFRINPRNPLSSPPFFAPNPFVLSWTSSTPSYSFGSFACLVVHLNVFSTPVQFCALVQLNLLCIKERLYPHIFCLCQYLAP